MFYVSFIKPIFDYEIITPYAKIKIIMNSILKNNYNSDTDLDKNFKLACDLFEAQYTHDDMLKMLHTGNIPQKHIAALKFDYVNDRIDVLALLNNLTGCDGKIREAVALKIHSILLCDKTSAKLFADLSAKIFADATIDINANICRLIINSAVLLKDYNDFCLEYTKQIVEYTIAALNELDKFIFRDKKYVINKQLFKLYWCMEALLYFFEYTEEQTLKCILERCALQSEYTIREKAAQLIIKSNRFDDLHEKLLSDENYYVRQALNHPCFF